MVSCQRSAALLVLAFLAGALALPVPFPEGAEPAFPETTPKPDTTVEVKSETPTEPPASPSEIPKDEGTVNDAPSSVAPRAVETDAPPQPEEQGPLPAVSFGEFDINEDGFVDPDEFSQVGSFPPESFIEADADGDGLLTAEEFLFFSLRLDSPPSDIDIGASPPEGETGGDAVPPSSEGAPPDVIDGESDFKAGTDVPEEREPTDRPNPDDVGGEGDGQKQPDGKDGGEDGDSEASDVTEVGLIDGLLNQEGEGKTEEGKDTPPLSGEIIQPITDGPKEPDDTTVPATDGDDVTDDHKTESGFAPLITTEYPAFHDK